MPNKKKYAEKAGSREKTETFAVKSNNISGNKKINGDADEVLRPEDVEKDSGGIAVIEAACRFPDASTPEEFWDNIAKGRCSIREVPQERWNIDGYYDPAPVFGKTSCRTGAFIEDVYGFDAELFGIEEKEACVMDPQQRIMLELFFELLERAGCKRPGIEKKSVGLYLGAGSNQFYEFHLNTLHMQRIQEFDSFSGLSSTQQKEIMEEWKKKFGKTETHSNILVDNIPNMVASRVSQEFNLSGPSMVVDTACSSALVTIHLACEALKRGECDIAAAGGANLLLTPSPYIYFSYAGALSRSGNCRVFDADADGFVPGEGAGLVLLKPLNKAAADGDRILGVIRASMVNNDGRSIGVMAPNPDGQREVVEQLYRKNSIDPCDIQYVEAHGTGTTIGDPSEIRALSKAFSGWKPANQSIAVGSVKANIGHLLNAAGIAGFIKVLLALKNKKKPPSVNIHKPNPLIKFERTPFRLIEEAEEWEVPEGKKRMAAVNSFGFGGTNCHMVIEEYTEQPENAPARDRALPAGVICMDSHTKKAMESKIGLLIKDIKAHPEYSLDDICFTVNSRQNNLKYRFSIAPASVQELEGKLGKAGTGDIKAKSQDKMIFMFTGQGAQYVGMGREMYECLPGFKRIIEECSKAFYPHLECSITDLIYGGSADEAVLARTGITQPVIFTLDYALGRYLMELGAEPSCLMGHSLGEWVAACLAGSVALEDAAGLVALRGRLMQELRSQGAMAAVFTGSGKIEELLSDFKDRLWVAGYNITHQVVSGYSSAMDEFEGLMQRKGIACKRLKVSQAFHTPLMEPMLEKFGDELGKVDFLPPSIPIISNITADVMNTAPDKKYWLEHIMSAVRFEQSISRARELNIKTFVEAGPDKILSGMARGIPFAGEINILETQDRKKAGLSMLMNAVGGLFKTGVSINWRTLYEGCGPKRLSLATYPFEHKTFMPDFGACGEMNITRLRKLFYKWGWQQEEGKKCNKEAGAILLFHDGSFTKLFGGRTGFKEVYEVVKGKGYGCKRENVFTVNPGNPEDYRKLFEALPCDIGAIVHMWGFLQEKCAPEEIPGNEKILDESTFSLLCIGKMLQECGKEVKVIVAADSMFEVTGEETLRHPHQYTGAAVGQAIDHENDGIRVCVVDLDRKEYSSSKEIAEILMDEILNEVNEESLIAVRKGARFARRLEKIDRRDGLGNLEFNDGETYLITGGAGPVAGEICIALAGQAKLNLVLTGRSKLPPRDEWGDLQHYAPDIREKIDVIKNIEASGSRAAYYEADVSGYEEMEALIKRINADMGLIYGVIHGAGLWDSSSFRILSKDIRTVKSVFKPKVQGVIITDMVTRNQPLKFFVMLSSVSASKKIWSAGLGDYAAANSFLDGYAVYRKRTGAPGVTLALNYSLWADRGMGGRYGGAAALAVKSQGLNPLDPRQAVDAFLLALRYGDEAVVHILEMLQLPEEKTAAASLRDDFGSTVVKVHAERRTDIKDVRNEVYRVIAQHLQIPVEQLDISANFMEIGLDSVGATKVISEIGQLLEMELYPTLVFEYQTPEELTRYIEGTLKEDFKDDGGVKAVHVFNTVRQEGEAENGDIAVIGMSLRIPGADSIEEYWELLTKGKCAVGDVPEERWDMREFFSDKPESAHTMYTRKGGFIRRPYDFDPIFFGMSPVEAEVTDPQQRIFLSVAWEAIQRAGYGSRYDSNRIGVFAGCEQNTYMEHFAGYNSYIRIKKRLFENGFFRDMNIERRNKILSDIMGVLEPAKTAADAVAGNGLNEIAARVSHCLNLTGPSLIVNSACSSSLAAVHLACESLRSRQADMAVAGGVNLNLSPTPYICLSRVTALSPSGACYPFDRRADGMVLSEGAGAVLMKPLKKAIEDRDHIHAVIKGSAVNNDGHSQGITAPRPQGQAETIRNAYVRAGINPQTVSYIETHGTGTPLGDPIEVEGMTMAMRSFTDKKSFCGIGSVKSSIGHMLSAAGIVSLIKVVLALENKLIPHTINYEQPNPHIQFEKSPFYVVDKMPRKWERKDDAPLRAGVNAFGFGGTNAHIILEEAREAYSAPGAEIGTPYFLTITGRNERLIKTVAGRLKNYIRENSPDMASLCYTVNNSQREMSYKTALKVNDRAELLESLEAVEKGAVPDNAVNGRSNPNKEMPVYIMFRDTGTIHMNSVRRFCEVFGVFDGAYRECEDELYRLSGSNRPDENNSFTQFAFYYAIGVMLENVKIRPSAVIAEGMGILSAMVLAGHMALSNAVALICKNTAEGLAAPERPESVFGGCKVITGKGAVTKNIGDSIVDYCGYRPAEPSWVNLWVRKDEGIIIISGEHENTDAYAAQARFCLAASECGSGNPAALFIDLIARLYVSGVKFNPNRLYHGSARKLVLPGYPFEYQTYKVSYRDEDLDGTADITETRKVAAAGQGISKAGKAEEIRGKLINIRDLKPLDGEFRKRSAETLKQDLSLLSFGAEK